MYREIHQQLKILLTQQYEYTKKAISENELLRKEIIRLQEEINNLKQDVGKNADTSHTESIGSN